MFENVEKSCTLFVQHIDGTDYGSEKIWKLKFELVKKQIELYTPDIIISLICIDKS